MKIGVFVPIGNNGWLISTHAPQYMPTFELNKAIVQKAEHYHFASASCSRRSTTPVSAMPCRCASS
jgi:hypothetical protein